MDKERDSKIVSLEEWRRTRQLGLVLRDGKIEVVEKPRKEPLAKENRAPVHRRA